jgi:dTDP-4-dehydrorhamnose reductase
VTDTQRRRWLITGAWGQLGSDLVRTLPGEEVVAIDRDALDITDEAAVRAMVSAVRPHVLISAAAYTAVDAAEADEETAMLVNGAAPGLLAAAGREVGARTIQISTDYVFPGDATEPYAEDAPTGPKSAYGRTKLAGERAVLAADPSANVVRTAWVYGETGNNFVKTMVTLEAQRETVSVVDDQRGSPTWSRHLARALVELGRSGADPGIYHCTGSGDTTWYGFTQAIFEELGADPARVLPTTTDAFPRPAPRPAYSVLSHQRWIDAGLTPMPHWRDALAEAFDSCGSAWLGGVR